MNRLIRSNLMPLILVLLGLVPAAMGMAPGLVRCEHDGARSHLADAQTHATDHAAGCCEHGDSQPAAPCNPSDDEPCEDTPLEIDLAPVQSQPVGPDLDDAPQLPFFAWLPAEQATLVFTRSHLCLDADPPALQAGLRGVGTTILLL